VERGAAGDPAADEVVHGHVGGGGGTQRKDLGRGGCVVRVGEGRNVADFSDYCIC
jgi:hypothetical protein